jgi:hypothetical protein
MVLTPLLVMVEPARMAKLPAVPRRAGSSAAAANVVSDPSVFVLEPVTMVMPLDDTTSSKVVTTPSTVIGF